MANIDASTVLQLINTGGVIGVLAIIVVLFMRGDLLPRRVWEELTQQVVEQVVDKIADAVCERLRS